MVKPNLRKSASYDDIHKQVDRQLQRYVRAGILKIVYKDGKKIYRTTTVYETLRKNGFFKKKPILIP